MKEPLEELSTCIKLCDELADQGNYKAAYEHAMNLVTITVEAWQEYAKSIDKILKK